MLLNNRYQIKKTLAAGGFGETFLAEDIQMPSNRSCVIKQLKLIQNNPQIYQLVQERFQREAAILEELGGKHNQIPNLYAYFESNGLFYLVQEYIDGDTLATKVSKQGTISESIVREILVSLLQLLDYIHSRRIIHRDIKPDNIILRYQDGLPVLIDFGAVREVMGTAVNSQGNPTSTIVIGTPGYMPSEQAMGRPVFSSDLYSLGISVIYLLTGKYPEELETDSRTGEIIWHHHALNVSPTLKSVIDKAIYYHPRERFATAKEMLDALQNGYVHLPEQTVAKTAVVQPNPIYASVNKSKEINPIIIGILSAGALVSTSVIASMMLTKTSQTVVQQSPSELDSTKNAQPSQNTQLPALNTPKTTEQTQANQSTTTNQTVIASSPLPNYPEQTQANQNITTNKTAITPSPVPNYPEQTQANQNITTNKTAITPSPIPNYPEQTQANQNITTNKTAITPSPLPNSVQQETKLGNNQTTPNTSLPSPQTEVVNYYNDINSGNYQYAWDRLPKALQEDTKVHPNGYASFADWWKTVKSIDVQQVDVIETNSNNTVVNTRVAYNMKAGNTMRISLNYTLSWDNQTQKWRFIRIK
ncbi:Serine/Threonine protein kinase [Calothrix sp. PCC 7716]|nr:Serine/Threonine protein kinase [Calothrix sp. PCC 7716]